MTEESPSFRRIRLLLERANGKGVTDAERDSCNEAAMRLMAQHGVSEEMLTAARPQDDQPTSLTISLTGAYSAEQMTLANLITEAFPAKMMFHRSGRRFESVKIYGFASDLEKIEFLFTLLLVQMMNASANVTAEYVPSWYNGSEIAAATRRARAGFMRGFSHEIHERLTAMFADARRTYDSEHGGTGTDLVVTSKKDRAVSLFEAENPNLKTRKSTPYDGRAAARGREAARRADLGGTKLHTTAQRQIGG